MKNFKLIKLLAEHEIQSKEINGRVIVLEVSSPDGTEAIYSDITGFSIRDINNWMGFEMVKTA